MVDRKILERMIKKKEEIVAMQQKHLDKTKMTINIEDKMLEGLIEKMKVTGEEDGIV